MAHDVFISYSTQDKPVADAVCATLESRKIRCWIAPRDVTPSIPFAEALIDGINQSRLLVLVFSNNSNKSPQVMREVERAVNKGIPILTLRIEDVMPSKSLEYFLSAPHWLDALTPPLEQHLQKLADTVQVLLSNEVLSKFEAESFNKSSPKDKKRSKIKPAYIIVSVAVIALGLVGVLFVKGILKGDSNKITNNSLTSSSTIIQTTTPTQSSTVVTASSLTRTTTPAATGVPTSASSSTNITPITVLKPDLVVQNISWYPDNPSMGNNVSFTVAITNIGTNKAASSYVAFYIDGVFLDSIQVNTINSGATNKINYNWKAELGTHIIKTVIDLNNMLEESDETNNAKEVTFAETLNVDLVIQDITWTPATPTTSNDVIFTLTVKNQGDGISGQFSIYWYIDGFSRFTPYSIDKLYAGQTEKAIFTWPHFYTDGVATGTHNMKWVADDQNKVHESDETNNSKTITITIP